MPSALRPHVKTIRTSKIKRIQKTNFKMEKQETKKTREIFMFVSTRTIASKSSKQIVLTFSRSFGSMHPLSHTHTHTNLNSYSSSSQWASDRSLQTHTLKELTRPVLPVWGKMGRIVWQQLFSWRENKRANAWRYIKYCYVKFVASHMTDARG